MEIPTRYPYPFPKSFVRVGLALKHLLGGRGPPSDAFPNKAFDLKFSQRLIMLHTILILLVEIWNEMCIFCKHSAVANSFL